MNNPYSFEIGERVHWWHSDRNGSTDYAGVVVGQDSKGRPYWRVKRDDTGKTVPVRTTALRHGNKP